MHDNDATGKFEINRVKILVGHTASINAIKFAPNGSIIATASNDKVKKLDKNQLLAVFNQTICLWNCEGHLLRQNEVHQAAVLSIAWVTAGIYTGGADSTLKFTYFNTRTIEEPSHLCW